MSGKRTWYAQPNRPGHCAVGWMYDWEKQGGTCKPWAYRGGVQHPPPPEITKGFQNQPDCENLKIAEFRTPAHQDVPKKGSKILKLPRFTIVLH